MLSNFLKIICISVIILPAHAKSSDHYRNFKIKLLLDADPALGVIEDQVPKDVDDGLAIIEALNSPKIDLKGITVVFGNSKLEKGLEVAKTLVKLKKSNVPVIQGAPGPALDKESLSITQATLFIKNALAKERLVIAAIGPLTNVASVIKHFPQEAKNIQRIIVVMGRSPGHHFYIGSFGPVEDFNYVQDPISAKLVVESGIPMVMAPFELSSKVLIEPHHLENIRDHKTDVSEFLFAKTQAWLNFWHTNFPDELGFHPWDSAAIAYLTHPEFLKCEKRGYRMREVADKAHGVGDQKTGQEVKKQPWLEWSKDYHTPQHEYCFDFKSGKKKYFTEGIIKNLF